MSLLFVNRLSPYTGTVGTGSGLNARYQDANEFNDTILEIDSQIILARVSSPGDPYAGQFIGASANISHGGIVPAHIGFIAKITVDGVVSRQTTSLAELLEVKANAALYPNASAWHFMEAGCLYISGTVGVVYYPTYTKTAACQAPDVDELAEVMGTVGSLPKDGAVTPELYTTAMSYYMAYLQKLEGKDVILPEIQQIERQLQAA